MANRGGIFGNRGVRRNRNHSNAPKSGFLQLERLETRIAMHAGHGDPTQSSPVFGPPELAEVSPAPVAAAVSPLSALPILEGLPSARAKLYLDFNGVSYGGQTYPAFSRDSDATTFSDNELKEIRDIWGRVVEFFSPFRIDVTTKDPINYTANRVSRIVIVNDNGGGWAYVGSFNGGDGGFGRVGDDGWGDPASMAMVIAHEAGHTFGLSHQSVYEGATKTQEYNPGDSAKGPIMGAPYGSNRQLWWKGPAQSSNPANYQDDMQVITRSANGFSYRIDEAGSIPISAKRLTSEFGQWSASGVITTTTDKDMYALEITQPGKLLIQVDVADNDSAMLDAKLDLLNSESVVLASSDPSGQTASLQFDVEPGLYHPLITSHGSYGDVGQYRLTANFVERPWEQSILATTTGQARIQGTSAMIEGVGSGPRGSSDSMNFLYQSKTGDAVVSTKVDQLDETLRFLNPGVGFRDGAASNDKQVSVVYTPTEGVRFSYRSEKGSGNVVTEPVVLPKAPWLRVSRSGDVFTGQYSTDGQTWIEVGKAEVSMSETVRAGVFAGGAPATRDRKVYFSEITINSPTANLPGDINQDGKVDVVDFSILRANFGESNARREQGDINGDARVDLRDFQILRTYFGDPTEGVASTRAASRPHRLAVSEDIHTLVGAALASLHEEGSEDDLSPPLIPSFVS